MIAQTEGCINQYEWLSEPFKVERGIRQGYPLLSALCVLAVELLAIKVRIGDIKGVKFRRNNRYTIWYTFTAIWHFSFNIISSEFQKRLITMNYVHPKAWFVLRLLRCLGVGCIEVVNKENKHERKLSTINGFNNVHDRLARTCHVILVSMYVSGKLKV